jgi:nucleotide-binding universal stress UspA family protein
MKSILIPIGGSDTDGVLLETALAAARPFAAHMQFLHVRIDVGEAAQHTPHMEFASGPALRDALQQLELQQDARSSASIQHVHDFCAQAKIELCDAPGRSDTVTASCREVQGRTLERVLFHARHSDLIVVGRARKPNGLPSDFIEHLLLNCGRPVLIAGSTPPQSLTRTIMVCWRESAEAARAVTAAASLLADAQRVIFTSVAERSAHTVAIMDDVVRQFAWRGAPTQMHIIAPGDRPVHELLAAAAHDCQADLIVLGAYGHSHMRELVFGGCTQSFIHHADRPVLLMH